ncbi:MAG: tRNA 2-thiouridine(34) synthase MnmA [Clostridiales bacterium]|nr:tRNA 2-thiouridine(34) synthase MnmA [Clostridiales bacterium]
MSGGVDSSVAALLMKEAGYDCVGVMLKLFDANADAAADGTTAPRPAPPAAGAVAAASDSAAALSFPANPRRTCCSIEDAEDARAVASRIGIPFYVLNFKADFQKSVVDRFVSAYRGGATPNPCIDCNRFIKFERLISRAEVLGFERLATGHYARVERDADSRRWLLKKGLDQTKDQSYVLYAMTQRQLARVAFPLGALRKNEVREFALANGFRNAKKRDSQDICFVPDGDYTRFIEAYTGERQAPGPFVNADGAVVGSHRGAIRYTIGQRKGLGLAMPEPVYVYAKSMEENKVFVGAEAALYTKSLCAQDVNLIPIERLDGRLRVTAKTRYRQPEQRATIEQTGPDLIRVEFDEPQRAVTRGQAVVFYDGDLVVGGGTIL